MPKPMMPFNASPGLMGGPQDRGAAPHLKGGAKAAQRAAERAADERMHSSPARYNTSGIETAMGKQADRMHSPKKPPLDRG